MSIENVLSLYIRAHYVGRDAFRQLSGDIDGLVASTSKLEKVGAAFSTIGNGMLVAGVAVAAGLGVAVAKAAEFEQSIIRAGAAGNMTKQQMGDLQNSILNLSDTWGISSQDIADASYYLLSHIQSLGYTTQDVVNNQILPAFAAYSVASGILGNKPGAVNIQAAMQNVPPLFAGMHVPMSQWAQDLGFMTVIEQRSGLTQAQLLGSATRFAPTGGFLGMPFPQSMAIMGALATLGVSGQGTGGARVGTELAAAMRTLMTTPAGTAELEKALGQPGNIGAVNALFNKQGQLADPSGLLMTLYNYINAPGTSPTDRFKASHTLFSATGQRALLELMTPGGMSVFGNELVTQTGVKGAPMMTGAQAYDFMLTRAQEQAGGPQAQWEIMKARLENLAIVIGNLLIPNLLIFAQWVGNAAHALREFIQGHPKLAGDIVKGAVPALLGGGLAFKSAGGLLSFLGRTPAVGEGIGQGIGNLFGAGKSMGELPARIWNAPQGAALPMLGAIGGGIKAIPGNIVSGFQKLVDVFKNLGPAILSAGTALPGLIGGLLPIIAIALLIAGIITIVILTFTRFRKEAETAAATIGKGLNPIFKLFGAIFSTAAQQIDKAWKAAWPSIDKAMKSLFAELPKILPLLQLLGVVIGAVVAVILGVIVGLANGFINALPFIIGFVSKVISFFGDLAKFLIDLVKAIFGKGGWGAVGDDLKAIVSDIWGIITNAFGAITHFIGGFIQGIIGFFQMLFDKLVGHSLIPDLINGIIKWFTQLPQMALKWGSGLIQGLINGIEGMAGNLASSLGNVIHNAVNAIPGGATLAHLMHIPGYASGTFDAPGGLAWVGERGPELVYLPQHSQVMPNGAIPNGPQQGGMSALDFWWLALNIRNSRMALGDGRLPVTYDALPSKFDLSYRYAYQKTA